jgi:hypothetical protein
LAKSLLLGRGQYVRRWRAAADPRELDARPVCPEARAESIEDLQRLGERIPCRAPLIRAPLSGAAREESSSG